ncbi:Hypp6219 [Branchiostoma lanceolatum]|uniref:Hypp6219 protein n=1 Tax=Branchiostoma lanceolatum TaxID=7740 RepID=A0A8J9W0X3_BRALA|nr:Hypp6219 [Branchiostoma lanceolatum]
MGEMGDPAGEEDSYSQLAGFFEEAGINSIVVTLADLQQSAATAVSVTARLSGAPVNLSRNTILTLRVVREHAGGVDCQVFGSHHATQPLKEHQSTMEMVYGKFGRDSLPEFKLWRVGEAAVVGLPERLATIRVAAGGTGKLMDLYFTREVLTASSLRGLGKHDALDEDIMTAIISATIMKFPTGYDYLQFSNIVDTPLPFNSFHNHQIVYNQDVAAIINQYEQELATTRATNRSL